jgi:tetratricopeptide (TPR) repeat protein
VIFKSSKKRIKPVIFCVWVLVCSCTQVIHASAFDDANRLYYEGKFSDAAAAYEKLIHSDMATPALYFNLGNAWFKSGQIGRAISAYKQAERYTPRDPDLRANLQFARNQTQGPSLKLNPAQRSLTRLTLNEWTLLAAGSIWVLLLLLSVTQWRPAWNRTLRGFLALWVFVSVVLCGCFAAALSQDISNQSGVVVAAQAVVRNGPLEESKNAFTLQDGSEVRVLDRKDDWLLITTDPQRTGWLRKDHVLLGAN